MASDGRVEWPGKGSTKMVETQEWQAEAVRLRREEQMETAEIAARVHRSPSRVRRVLAEANAARFTEPTSGDRVLSSAEASEAFDGPIPGQTTVDDFAESCEHGVAILDECAECDPQDEVSLTDAAITTLIREAGEATGPLQTRPGEEPEGEVEEPYVPPAPAIKGTAQLALNFGPNAAPVTCATVKFTSEKLTSGYFEMGDVVSGRFTARITGINGSEKLDKDLDEFVAKPQAQTATITEITID